MRLRESIDPSSIIQKVIVAPSIEWDFNPTSYTMRRGFEPSRNPSGRKPVLRPCSVIYNGPPLRRNEIRLLEFYPDFSDGQIKCRLLRRFLNDPTLSYTALSYRCGDPYERGSILVDGVPFPVPLNLENALQDVLARGHTVLWADAVSIHQTDPDEYHEQISLLSQIYHNADTVIAWIGSEAHGSRKVMSLLRETQPSISRFSGSRALHDTHVEKYQPELKAFFRRSYWTRAWIIQEIALATRVKILCGHETAGFSKIETLTELIAEDDAFKKTHLHHVRRLCATRRRQIERRQMALLEVLYDSREARVSKPKDRVFAVLGLISDQTRYMGSVRTEWPEEAICIEMTKTSILATKSLDIVFAAGTTHNSRRRLPSWCPDFFRFPSEPVLGKLCGYISGQDVRWRSGERRGRWYATGESRATRRSIRIDHGRFLVVQGFPLGRINALGSSLYDSRPPQQGPSSTVRRTDEMSITDQLRQWANSSAVSITAKVSRSLVLYTPDYSDLVEDTRALRYLFEFDNSRFYHRTQVAKLQHKYSKLLEWRKRNKDLMIRGKRLSYRAGNSSSTENRSFSPDSAARLGRPNDTLKEIPGQPVYASRPQGGAGKRSISPDLYIALDGMSDLIEEGLRYMTTEKDDVGWAHPDAKIGDKVFLLEGCSMPAVLRPSREFPKSYRVVGHAYVEGAMDGEQWTRDNEKKRRNVTIG